MLPDKAKFTMCSIIKLASIAFDETSSYWSAKKISAFHWPIKKICHYFCFRLVNIAHRLGSTFTEIDRNGLNDRIGRLNGRIMIFSPFPNVLAGILCY